jgi:hypothetical protein
MNATIPLLHLDSLTETQVVPTAAPLPHLPLDRPHRNAFYKTGLCLRGSARLRVNLEIYELRPASLIVLSPYTNIQWVTRPADCEARRGQLSRQLPECAGPSTRYCRRGCRRANDPRRIWLDCALRG